MSLRRKENQELFVIDIKISRKLKLSRLPSMPTLKFGNNCSKNSSRTSQNICLKVSTKRQYKRQSIQKDLQINPNNCKSVRLLYLQTRSQTFMIRWQTVQVSTNHSNRTIIVVTKLKGKKNQTMV